MSRHSGVVCANGAGPSLRIFGGNLIEDLGAGPFCLKVVAGGATASSAVGAATASAGPAGGTAEIALMLVLVTGLAPKLDALCGFAAFTGISSRGHGPL